jgi:hypothetical protein
VDFHCDGAGPRRQLPDAASHARRDLRRRWVARRGHHLPDAVSYLLSLLALKLTSTRRISHVYDIAADPGAALFRNAACRECCTR